MQFGIYLVTLGLLYSLYDRQKDVITNVTSTTFSLSPGRKSLRSVRLDAGLSIDDLAALTNVSAGMLEAYEAGRSRPLIETAAIIAAELEKAIRVKNNNANKNSANQKISVEMLWSHDDLSDKQGRPPGIKANNRAKRPARTTDIVPKTCKVCYYPKALNGACDCP